MYMAKKVLCKLLISIWWWLSVDGFCTIANIFDRLLKKYYIYDSIVIWLFHCFCWVGKMSMMTSKWCHSKFRRRRLWVGRKEMSKENCYLLNVLWTYDSWIFFLSSILVLAKNFPSTLPLYIYYNKKPFKLLWIKSQEAWPSIIFCSFHEIIKTIPAYLTKSVNVLKISRIWRLICVYINKSKYK